MAASGTGTSLDVKDTLTQAAHNARSVFKLYRERERANAEFCKHERERATAEFAKCAIPPRSNALLILSLPPLCTPMLTADTHPHCPAHLVMWILVTAFLTEVSPEVCTGSKAATPSFCDCSDQHHKDIIVDMLTPRTPAYQFSASAAVYQERVCSGATCSMLTMGSTNMHWRQTL